MQAIQIPNPRGRYQDAAGARCEVRCCAQVFLPPGSALSVSEVDSLAAYLAARGLTPVAADPGPVPVLTARQLRLWLLGDGITPEAVDAQIAAIADAAARARAQVEWEYAGEYRHDHPLVLQIGSALGLTQAQIDAGFRTAAAL